MPEMDGFEATHAIREQRDQHLLPIIAMTAHILKEDERKCLAAGMNEYISKPINQEKLFTTLIRLIHQKEDDLPFKTEAFVQKINLLHTITKVPGSSNNLPDRVPGIDVKEAVHALGITADVFLEILQIFLKNHEHILSKIETAWGEQDREKVITLVHSLKGSASGIGAFKLYNLTFGIEKLCRKAKQLPSMEKVGFKIFKNELTRVLTSIKALVFKQLSLNKVKPKINVNTTKAMDILQKFEQALKFPELGELETLMELLESVFLHPVIEDLKKNITSYDHDLAMKTVKKLQSIIKRGAYEKT